MGTQQLGQQLDECEAQGIIEGLSKDAQILSFRIVLPLGVRVKPNVQSGC